MREQVNPCPYHRDVLRDLAKKGHLTRRHRLSIARDLWRQCCRRWWTEGLDRPPSPREGWSD